MPDGRAISGLPWSLCPRSSQRELMLASGPSSQIYSLLMPYTIAATLSGDGLKLFYKFMGFIMAEWHKRHHFTLAVESCILWVSSRGEISPW